MAHVYLKSKKAEPAEGEYEWAAMTCEAEDTERLAALKANGWEDATEEEYNLANPAKDAE